MSSPLSGLRCWITRPAPAATNSAARWREAGALAEAVPLLSLTPLPLPERLVASLQTLPAHARILFTSANAARFLAEALRPHTVLGPRVRELPACAVGAATAQAAREEGFSVDWVADRATGQQLAQELLRREGSRSRVLLPGSSQRRPEVERLLRAAGAEVVAFSIYANRPIDALDPERVRQLREEGLDLFVGYSPSALRALVQLCGAEGLSPATLAPVACMGETTAQAAREVGLEVVAAPEAPGEEALLADTALWWARRGHPPA